VTTLGVVARADNGGLGAQTYEMCRWMQPDRILVAMVGHTTRGPADLSRYAALPGEMRHSYVPTQQDAAWLAECDVVWTAETWYGSHIPEAVHRRGGRYVLHGNPEMGVEVASDLWLPTYWLQARFPEATVVPFPVARDVLPYAPVPIARTFYHVASPAMEDRNGTQIVAAALPFVHNRCRLLVRGRSGPSEKIGNVEVTFLGDEAGLYHLAWPRADVLLLPRRFGGLCLPAQEAWSLGMPVAMLDLEPYRGKIPEYLLVSARSPRDVRMKGGWFQVFDADPQDLASVMDALIEDETLVRDASDEADALANGLSWEGWRGDYAKLLDRSTVSG
jgi:hypothetical protein